MKNQGDRRVVDRDLGKESEEPTDGRGADNGRETLVVVSGPW